MTSSEQRWHEVGPVSQFPAGQVVRVQVNGRALGVIRTAAGVYAIGDRCPHQGASLSSGEVRGTMLASEPDEYIYGLEETVIRCPWHAYEFRIDSGESVGGTFRGRVPIYPAKIVDGKVFCTLDRAVKG